MPDPIVFTKDLRVTLQKIDWIPKFKSKEELERNRANASASKQDRPFRQTKDWHKKFLGLSEHQDDYCATAFVYCRTPQPVPRLNITSATANIDRMPYEILTPFEEMILQLAPKE